MEGKPRVRCDGDGGGVKGSVTQAPGSVGSILNSTRGERAGKPSALGTGAENQGPSYCYANAILCYSSRPSAAKTFFLKASPAQANELLFTPKP